jgi:hypothetical protein
MNTEQTQLAHFNQALRDFFAAAGLEIVQRGEFMVAEYKAVGVSCAVKVGPGELADAMGMLEGMLQPCIRGATHVHYMAIITSSDEPGYIDYGLLLYRKLR